MEDGRCKMEDGTCQTSKVKHQMGSKDWLTVDISDEVIKMEKIV